MVFAFHGTRQDFDRFQGVGDYGLMFFTTRRECASGYAMGYGDDWMLGARVIPVVLDIHNPLLIDRSWLENMAARLTDTQLNACPYTDGPRLRFVDGFEDSEEWARDIVFTELFSHGHLAAAGHDSIIIDEDCSPVEHMEGDWDHFQSYALTDPDKVRIARGFTV